MKNYVTFCCNYVHLDNEIGARGCESLLNGLMHNKTLRELNLNCERITLEELCNILL